MIAAVSRFVKKRPMTTAYLIVGLSFALSMVGIVVEVEARQADVEEAGEQICDSITDRVQVLSDLIEVVVSTDGGSIPTPLASLPQFQDLDPVTQEFVRAIDTAAASGAPEDTLSARLLAFRDARLPDSIPEFCTD